MIGSPGEAATTTLVQSFGATVDLEDAVVAVLCEQPGTTMSADEVRAGCPRYLGYTPDRSYVVLALQSDKRVIVVGDDAYRGNCS